MNWVKSTHEDFNKKGKVKSRFPLFYHERTIMSFRACLFARIPRNLLSNVLHLKK